MPAVSSRNRDKHEGLRIELAGLEPTRSWVRSRRSLASNPRHFQDFLRTARPLQSLSVTNCRPITRGFLAIWSHVLRFVTRSVIDSDRRTCLSQAARPGPANQRIANHVRKARAIGATPEPVQELCGEATTEAMRRAQGGHRSRSVAGMRQCRRLGRAQFALPSFVRHRSQPHGGRI
jgi:hypothetical protein